MSDKKAKPRPDVRICVFDDRRGNREGEEADKLLAFYPSWVPVVDQVGCVGLAQALTSFAATFGPTGRQGVMDGDQHRWALYCCEPPCVWMLLVVRRAWATPSCTDAALWAALRSLHGGFALLHGPISRLLDQDTSASVVRALLAPHVEHVGSRLARGPDARGGDDSAPRLRNPLGPMDRAPLLRVSKSAFLEAQALATELLVTSSPSGRLVQGVCLMWRSYVVWSTLEPQDTQALHMLASRALLPLAGRPRTATGGGGYGGGAVATAAAAASSTTSGRGGQPTASTSSLSGGSSWLSPLDWATSWSKSLRPLSAASGSPSSFASGSPSSFASPSSAAAAATATAEVKAAAAPPSQASAASASPAAAGADGGTSAVPLAALGCCLLDPGCWQVTGSGFMTLRVPPPSSTAAAAAAAPSPSSPTPQQQQQQQQQPPLPVHLHRGAERGLLLPYTSGPLLVLLLLHEHAALDGHTLAPLAACLRARCPVVASSLGHAVPSSNVWHVPGYRYRQSNEACGTAQASPAVKVSTLSTAALAALAQLQNQWDRGRSGAWEGALERQTAALLGGGGAGRAGGAASRLQTGALPVSSAAPGTLQSGMVAAVSNAGGGAGCASSSVLLPDELLCQTGDDVWMGCVASQDGTLWVACERPPPEPGVAGFGHHVDRLIETLALQPS